MRCSVLTQVERSRRPRRRRPLVVLVLAAVVGAGAYAGFQHFRGHEEPASAAPKPRPKPAAPRTPAPRRASLIARPKPLALLSTPRPPRHGIPAVAARSGILVDASTGAVLWQKWPHRRRPIASTTKIMTATLVLERRRHDLGGRGDRPAAVRPLLPENGAGRGVHEDPGAGGHGRDAVAWRPRR